jgi:putative membrane protein
MNITSPPPGFASERNATMTAFAAILADVTQRSDDQYWGHMDGWGGGWMWLWGIAMMVLFAVLIVWAMRATDHRAGLPQRDPADRAKKILAERYASGELSTDEYRERVGELR